jgi:hypothetical protein
LRWVAHQSSMAAPIMIPATSLMMLPMAAAHMVESPSVTPRDVSMASPATMRIALSMKPKPTNGLRKYKKGSQLGEPAKNKIIERLTVPGGCVRACVRIACASFTYTAVAIAKARSSAYDGSGTTSAAAAEDRDAAAPSACKTALTIPPPPPLPPPPELLLKERRVHFLRGANRIGFVVVLLVLGGQENRVRLLSCLGERRGAGDGG